MLKRKLDAFKQLINGGIKAIAFKQCGVKLVWIFGTNSVEMNWVWMNFTVMSFDELS